MGVPGEYTNWTWGVGHLEPVWQSDWPCPALPKVLTCTLPCVNLAVMTWGAGIAKHFAAGQWHSIPNLPLTLSQQPHDY